MHIKDHDDYIAKITTAWKSVMWLCEQAARAHETEYTRSAHNAALQVESIFSTVIKDERRRKAIVQEALQGVIEFQNGEVARWQR